MKDNKSSVGKLIVLASFVYGIYSAMKKHGYLDEMKIKMEELKNKMKDEQEKWKEKYNTSSVKNEWSKVNAEEILRQRFAGGEISEEEYNSRMNVLKR
jgi:hypothetical protein